jgi:hypothetical protein
MEINDKNIRDVLKSEAFDLYYQNLDERIKDKYDYAIHIIKTIKVVSEKFVKKIQNTEFYEVRVSVGSNEYRTMLITADNPNFIEATSVVLLNSFFLFYKKQYKKEIEKARFIIKKLEE